MCWSSLIQIQSGKHIILNDKYRDEEESQGRIRTRMAGTQCPRSPARRDTQENGWKHPVHIRNAVRWKDNWAWLPWGLWYPRYSSVNKWKSLGRVRAAEKWGCTWKETQIPALTISPTLGLFLYLSRFIFYLGKKIDHIPYLASEHSN